MAPTHHDSECTDWVVTKVRAVTVKLHSQSHCMCSLCGNTCCLRGTISWIWQRACACIRCLVLANFMNFAKTVWMSQSRTALSRTELPFFFYLRLIAAAKVAKPVMYAKLPQSQNKLFHSWACNLNRSHKTGALNLGQGCYFCPHLCVFANRSFSVFIPKVETMPWCTMPSVYKLQSATKTYGPGKKTLTF